MARRAYGERVRESVTSSFRRVWGHGASAKWNGMVNELVVKASVYNLFRGNEPVGNRDHRKSGVREANGSCYSTHLTGRTY
jgi:hypothetical protein